MSASSTWTDERIETLIRLWRDGLSASAIARRLGGVSRNAVIGKIHRLGFGGRETPAQPGGTRARTPKPKPEPPIAPPRRTLVAAPSSAPVEAPPLAGTADMLTVGPHACRWPIGDPKAPGFAVCGRPAVRGAYCAPHGALAYRITPRDHLLRLAGLA
jgi:GcrA cell cycle regulator